MTVELLNLQVTYTRQSFHVNYLQVTYTRHSFHVNYLQVTFHVNYSWNKVFGQRVFNNTFWHNTFFACTIFKIYAIMMSCLNRSYFTTHVSSYIPLFILL